MRVNYGTQTYTHRPKKWAEGVGTNGCTHTHTTHIKTMRFKHGSHTTQKTISENMEDAHYHRVACW